MFDWLKKENKTNKEIAINKFKKVGLTFEEADYLAQDIAELSLYADNNLFDGDEDNVNNLTEAYNDKYYMSTVDSIIDNNALIKDIAFTGILARNKGFNFEIRNAIKNSVFDYLEEANLDNTNFKEAFIHTLETAEINSKKDIHHTYDDVEFEESQMSVAVSRSMMEDNNWIFLHTNLKKSVEWLENNNWNKISNGSYVHPKPTEDGKYRKIEIRYDDNDFPILRAELIDKQP